MLHLIKSLRIKSQQVLYKVASVFSSSVHPVYASVLCFLFAIIYVSPLFASDESISIYKEKCAYCHGDTGDGRGSSIHSLQVKPTDFTKGVYKYRTTAWGKFPTNNDIERSISYGLKGTSMPAYKDLLTSQEIKNLSKYVKGLSNNKNGTLSVPVQVPSSFKDANVGNGKNLYSKMGCIQCHGKKLDGLEDRLAIINTGRNLPGRSDRVPARDLTDYRNYRRGSSMVDLYTSIYTGLNGTLMTGYGSVLSKQEIIDVAAYLTHTFQEAEKTRWLSPDKENRVARGDYLLGAGVCELCHTTMNKKTNFIEELSYSGGMKVFSQDGIVYSRNITSDKLSGIGQLSNDKLKKAIKLGVSPNDGGVLYPFSMPWIFYHTMTDGDAEAISSALKRIPPIYNKILPAEPSSFGSSFLDKAKVMLSLKNRLLVFSEGNYGEKDPEKGGTIPDSSEDRLWSINPPIGIVSARDTIEKSGFKLPLVEITGSPQEDAKIRHGRYMVSITPCALCHTPTVGKVRLRSGKSLSGGIKVSLNTFNTVYSSNLTSDFETGLGSWSDTEIRRALRSGIKKDGSLMHYMAMPWAMFANMTEADTEAIIAYLRTLPAVNKKLPESRPTTLKDYSLSDGDFGIKTSVQKLMGYWVWLVLIIPIFILTYMIHRKRHGRGLIQRKR